MSIQAITKAEAIAVFGGKQSELARVLGLSRQRVGQFPDGPLPEHYDLKLRFVVFPSLGIEWPPASVSSNVDTRSPVCESEISDLAVGGLS